MVVAASGSTHSVPQQIPSHSKWAAVKKMTFKSDSNGSALWSRLIANVSEKVGSGDSPDSEDDSPQDTHITRCLRSHHLRKHGNLPPFLGGSNYASLYAPRLNTSTTSNAPATLKDIYSVPTLPKPSAPTRRPNADLRDKLKSRRTNK